MARAMTPEENAIAWQIINYLSEIPCLDRTRVCIARGIRIATHIQPHVVNVCVQLPSPVQLCRPRDYSNKFCGIED